jgi:ribonuclease R
MAAPAPAPRKKGGMAAAGKAIGKAAKKAVGRIFGSKTKAPVAAEPVTEHHPRPARRSAVETEAPPYARKRGSHEGRQASSAPKQSPRGTAAKKSASRQGAASAPSRPATGSTAKKAAAKKSPRRPRSNPKP